MLERYNLHEKQLPTIPTPHDGIIKKVSIENQFIIFEFEDDISYHDAIKYIKPEAKSLIIKYHLLNEDDFTFYKWHQPHRLLQKLFRSNGYYKEISAEKIIHKYSDIEYLYHNLGYCSIITQLFDEGNIVLQADVDYVEFEWIF